MKSYTTCTNSGGHTAIFCLYLLTVLACLTDGHTNTLPVLWGWKIILLLIWISTVSWLVSCKGFGAFPGPRSPHGNIPILTRTVHLISTEFQPRNWAWSRDFAYSDCVITGNGQIPSWCTKLPISEQSLRLYSLKIGLQINCDGEEGRKKWGTWLFHLCSQLLATGRGWQLLEPTQSAHCSETSAASPRLSSTYGIY